MLLEHFICGLVVSTMQPERNGPEIEMIDLKCHYSLRNHAKLDELQGEMYLGQS